MIVVVNNSGIGNRIKNVVSALRKGHLRNDTVQVNFRHDHLFQYLQCVVTPKIEQEISSTWRLEILPEDANKPLQLKSHTFIIVHDARQVFRIENSIDCEYHNIHPNMRAEFLRYFELIRFHPEIIRTVQAFIAQHDIEQRIGVHIRSWIDDPARQQLLHDMQAFILAMEQYSTQSFFLCSDSQEVIDTVHAHFPGRVVSRPIKKIQHITFDDSPHAGQDSLIDMLILSRCQALIGTYQSSFTEVAWWLGGTQQAVTIPTPAIVQQLC